MTSIYSYCLDDAEAIKGFISYHNAASFEVVVTETSIPNAAKNSCKLVAAKALKQDIASGLRGLVIFCDIDTRVINHKVGGNFDFDVAIYTRGFLPNNLSVLSGFMLLNITEKNHSLIIKFLEQWVEKYSTTDKTWYDDQRSLAVALYNSIFDLNLNVMCLKKIKSKLLFAWSTVPYLFVDAITHKGNDFYFSFIFSVNYRYLALVLDQFMIPLNALKNGIKKYVL